MFILAHRGASADAPENTLAAFKEAAAQRADGVELDVMLCATGELVVCHDEELSRLAGVPWRVAQTPWWKLKQADVGSKLGFSAASIPLLDEVFDVLPKTFIVNIELKCEELDDRGLSEAVGAFVERRGVADRVVISSFNALCLFRLAAKHPHLRRGYLIDPDKSFALHAQVLSRFVSRFSVHPGKEDCTPERVAQWHAEGLKVAVWTVDDAEQARQFRDEGVDYLITNRPRAIRDALGSPGR
jgi:glycerophosphoryl diester phosphodiesterase